MLLIKELENIALRGVVILTTSGVVRSVEDLEEYTPSLRLAGWSKFLTPGFSI